MSLIREEIDRTNALSHRVDDPALPEMPRCNGSGSLPRASNLPVCDRGDGAIARAGRAAEQRFQGSGGVGVVSSKVHRRKPRKRAGSVVLAGAPGSKPIVQRTACPTCVLPREPLSQSPDPNLGDLIGRRVWAGSIVVGTPADY